MTGPRWADVLDAMERRLAVAERHLAGEDVYVDHFVLPEGLGPLPRSHQARASALLDATQEMERRLTIELESVALRIRRSQTVGQADGRRPSPAYFDRSA